MEQWRTYFSMMVALAAMGCGDGESDESEDMVPSCESGEKLCPADEEDPDGAQMCVEMTRPETGCGAESCNPCELNGSVARCTPNGECGISLCLDGRLDCNGILGDGCEVDLRVDPDNCGTCGNVCEGACVAGECE